MPLVRVDLSKRLGPLEWFVDGLLLRGYLNMLASLPGQGKTAMLTALAWQASRPGGGEFLGEAVAAGTTLYVDYDAPGDGRSVRFWLEKHRAAYPDGDLSKIHVLEPDANTYGIKEGELSELADIARETAPSLIIVDSFMAAFPNTDPVRLTEVQGPLFYMRRLANETNAAVVLIDHLPKPMNGEKAGARGIMGSQAKPAQARAVHLLTRVPPGEVQGRHVLRWDTHKLTFEAVPEPFGLELKFDNDALFIVPTELPESYGETKTEKAIRAMQTHLELGRGLVVDRKDLLRVGIESGNIKETSAKAALKTLLERLGVSVQAVRLPGQGQPVGYRLSNPEPTDQLTQTGETSSETAKGFGHPPVTKRPEPTQTLAEDEVLI